MSTQKVLDANQKAIQQAEFVRQLLNDNNHISANESMSILIILEKMKETQLKLSQGSATVL